MLIRRQTDVENGCIFYFIGLITNRNDHELLSEHSRMRKTVANVIDERRIIGGNAYAENFIRYVMRALLRPLLQNATVGATTINISSFG